MYTWRCTKYISNNVIDCIDKEIFDLNKTRKHHTTKQQLYGHLPPISQTIQIRQTIHVGHCWRSTDELIRDIRLWTLTHGHASVGQPAKNKNLNQLYADTGYPQEDPTRVMAGGDGWRESQGTLCCWRNFLMMVMMMKILLNIYIYIYLPALWPSG